MTMTITRAVFRGASDLARVEARVIGVGGGARVRFARTVGTNENTATRADANGPGIEPDAGAWHRGWARIAIALVLAGQGMAFSLASVISPPEGAAYWVVHGGLCASALLVFALLGAPLVRECVEALRGGRITVDLLFLVSLGGAFGVSVFSTLQHAGGPVFHELVAILLAIYTVGKLLGARSRARALRAVEELRAEHDTCVVVAADGSPRRVPAADVQRGDRVRVAAGEPVAIDGVVRSGVGLVDTTPLTGEPEPAVFGKGDALLAGMRSVDGVFVIEASVPGGERRLDRMLREIEQARLKPSRLQIAADRLATRFVPLVVGVSLATFAFWLWRAGVTAAVENSLAVLVVACPCALGLATPLGVWSGLVRLGRLGIVARSGDFLEALAACDAALFDKTGTLCEPRLKIARFTVLPASPLAECELRASLVAAETGVSHPIAEALRTLSGPSSTASAPIETLETRIVPGRGVRARVRAGTDGCVREIVAGTARLFIDLGIAVTSQPARRESVPRAIHVAVDGAHAAVIELDEKPRERVAAIFAEMRSLGLAVEILTGDPSFPASAWPDVPRRTGVSPEDKSAHVRARQAAGSRVLFVGDGLNDAPALAAADASVAVRQGAELARSNALAVVAGESLGTLPAAVRLARGVRAAIRANLRFAAIYNTLGMAVAAGGLLHPVVAALLMAGSSAVVSARVLRADGS